MHAAIGPGVCAALAADKPQLARERITKVMASWPRATYDLIQVRELVGQATIAVYEGDGRQALQLMRSQWRALEKSHMLGLEPLAGTLIDLRARAAIQAGDWAEAKACVSKLAAIPSNVGVAIATTAAIAAARGDHQTALAELKRAEVACATTNLDLHVAAIADRIGLLEGGDAGRAARERAAAIVRTKEIRNAERALHTLVPWPS